MCSINMLAGVNFATKIMVILDCEQSHFFLRLHIKNDGNTILKSKAPVSQLVNADDT